jgi:hypothetical protein
MSDWEEVTVGHGQMDSAEIMARGCRASRVLPYMTFLTTEWGRPYMFSSRLIFLPARLTGGVGWPNITAFEGLVFS